MWKYCIKIVKKSDVLYYVLCFYIEGYISFKIGK